MQVGDLAKVINKDSEWFEDIGKITEIFQDSRGDLFYTLWFKGEVSGYSIFKSSDIESSADSTAI